MSAKCLTAAMLLYEFVIRIWAVRLTLGAVFKWTFSKLPANNMGRSGEGEPGDCRGQVATGRGNVLEFECFFRVPWNVSEFH